MKKEELRQFRSWDGLREYLLKDCGFQALPDPNPALLRAMANPEAYGAVLTEPERATADSSPESSVVGLQTSRTPSS